MSKILIASYEQTSGFTLFLYSSLLELFNPLFGMHQTTHTIFIYDRVELSLHLKVLSQINRISFLKVFYVFCNL